jgi:hypothetical protein
VEDGMSRLTDEELARTIAVAKKESWPVVIALTELRERRAADLTAEDREALEFAAGRLELARRTPRTVAERELNADIDRALSVLSKLLAAGGGE